MTIPLNGWGAYVLGLLAGCASRGPGFVPLGIYAGSEPLDLPALLGARSHFLLGPRQTGKSTLVRSLAPDLELNLADEEIFVLQALSGG
mgnify:CR=1 FL=1